MATPSWLSLRSVKLECIGPDSQTPQQISWASFSLLAKLAKSNWKGPLRRLGRPHGRNKKRFVFLGAGAYDTGYVFRETRKDVRATCTYLIFLPSSNDIIIIFKNNTHLFSFYKTIMSINILPKPSSNDAIYFSSKNNTRLFFLS